MTFDSRKRREPGVSLSHALSGTRLCGARRTNNSKSFCQVSIDLGGLAVRAKSQVVFELTQWAGVLSLRASPRVGNLSPPGVRSRCACEGVCGCEICLGNLRNILCDKWFVNEFDVSPHSWRALAVAAARVSSPLAPGGTAPLRGRQVMSRLGFISLGTSLDRPSGR